MLIGIERDAEAAADPAGDRLAKLREPGRRGIAHALADPVAKRLEDRRVGRLARVSHSEVDDLESPVSPLRGGLVEPYERIRGRCTQDGREGHALTLPVGHPAVSPRATRRRAT